MKAVVEKFNSNEIRSFMIKDIMLDYNDPYLHSHSLYELVLICNSRGKRFMGDSVEDFDQDEIAFMGPNLPHCWHIDSGVGKEPNAIVIHFDLGFFQGLSSIIPEFKEIDKMAKMADQGLIYKVKDNESLPSIFRQVASSSDKPTQILKLLDLLNKLRLAPTSPMASSSYTLGQTSSIDKINKVYEYIYANYQKEISIDDVASLTHLSKTSFCRYFKKMTRKSFFDFLKEVRISQACKLLIETDKNISEICFSCGYNTTANFNKQFKEITNMSPLIYRKSL